jgi:hypothetical protein
MRECSSLLQLQSPEETRERVHPHNTLVEVLLRLLDWYRVKEKLEIVFKDQKRDLTEHT